MAEYVNVGKLSEFPEGKAQPFLVNEEKVAVVNSDGRLYAVGGFCTHQRISLRGSYVEAKWLWCWLHYSAFDMETGAVMDGPAKDPIPVYSVRLEGEDVLVSLDETSAAAS